MSAFGLLLSLQETSDSHVGEAATRGDGTPGWFIQLRNDTDGRRADNAH